MADLDRTHDGCHERFAALARAADRLWRQLLFAYLVAFTLLIALIWMAVSHG